MSRVINLTKVNVFEAFFYFFMVFWCFRPSRFTPRFFIRDLIVSWSDFSIVVAVIVFIPCLLVYRKDGRKSRLVFLLFTLLCIWMYYRVYPNFFGGTVYITYPLLMSWLTMVVAYQVSSIVENHLLEGFISRLSWFLTLVFIVYALESLFGLGLRSVEGSYVTESFGLQRLHGPLGGAAAIYLAMQLVISVHLGNVISGKEPKLLHRVGLFITIFCTILTGARGAVLSLAFLFLIFLVFRNSLKTFFTLIILAPIVLAAMSPVISFERFIELDDPSRSNNYRVSMKLFTQSTEAIVMGLGHGKIWPWYYYDSKKIIGQDEFETGNEFATEYGYVLYHPHSTFLGVLVETGIIGLLLLLLIMLVPWITTGTVVSNNRLNSYLMIGFISTIPILMMDYFIFKIWPLSLVWWVYVFVLCRRKTNSAI